MCEHDVGIALSIHPHAREHDGSSCDLQRGGVEQMRRHYSKGSAVPAVVLAVVLRRPNMRTSESAPTSMVQAVSSRFVYAAVTCRNSYSCKQRLSRSHGRIKTARAAPGPLWLGIDRYS